MQPEPVGGTGWWSRVRWWLPWLTLGYATLLVVLTHLPRPEPFPPPPLHTDKLQHLVAYMVLGLLLGLTLHAGLADGSVPRPRAWRLAAALLAIAVFGALDEVTQPWFGRNCELLDWVADGIGAGLGLAIAYWLLRRAPR